MSLIADSPRLDAQLAIVPNATFESAVDDALAQFLRACTRQKVLYPTGCPFGTSVEDRLASDIEWTLPETPDATLAAAATPGVWALPRVTGTAHLSVDVQNIFDGSVHRLERDVPFAASYLVAFEGDRVSVTAAE